MSNGNGKRRGITRVAAPTPQQGASILEVANGDVWTVSQVWPNGHLTVKRPLRPGEASGQHAHVAAGHVYKGIRPEGWVVGWTTGRLRLEGDRE
jgi:hypothetical protein